MCELINDIYSILNVQKGENGRPGIPGLQVFFFYAFMVLIELEGESHWPKNEPNAKENKVISGLET